MFLTIPGLGVGSCCTETGRGVSEGRRTACGDDDFRRCPGGVQNWPGEGHRTCTGRVAKRQAADFKGLTLRRYPTVTRCVWVASTAVMAIGSPR